MINLDLLPSREKNNLDWDVWRRLVVVFGIAILVGALAFSAILVGLNFYFLQNLEKAALRLNLHRQLPLASEINSIEEKLAVADKKINQISEIRSKIRPKSSALIEIASLLPPNSSIISLRIKNDGGMDISGFIKERADLLVFKQALQNNEKISDLNFPLENLLKEKNIEFSLSFKMKPLNN